jgi:hypothetical protein
MLCPSITFNQFTDGQIPFSTAFTKALRYNFSFGNSLSKRLRNLMKVTESSFNKVNN